MTSVWLVEQDYSGFAMPVLSESAPQLLKADGRGFGSAWVPPAAELEGDGKEPGLAVLGPGTLVAQMRYAESLTRVLRNGVEILPLGGALANKYVLVNVVQICDAFDEDNSVVKRLPDGTIFFVKKYVLRGEAVKDVGLFRVPQRPIADLYATPVFRDLVREQHIEGLAFIPVEVRNPS